MTERQGEALRHPHVLSASQAPHLQERGPRRRVGPRWTNRRLGLERRRRPTVSDVRLLLALEEVVAVERAWFSCLRPSASRYALVYLPAKGIVASLELCGAARVPWRRCWPESQSACWEQQRGEDRGRGRHSTFTHFPSPLGLTPVATYSCRCASSTLERRSGWAWGVRGIPGEPLGGAAHPPQLGHPVTLAMAAWVRVFGARADWRPAPFRVSPLGLPDSRR